MARASLADIIAWTRRLIGDPAGAGSHFTDDDIEVSLDRRMTRRVEMPLSAVVSRAASGAEERLTWMASVGVWESDAVVLDASRVPIGAGDIDVVNYRTGTWTFATDKPQVYASGQTFDIFGTAADLLEEWQASDSAAGGEITSFTTDGQTVVRAKGKNRADLIVQYRRQALPTFGSMQRSDLGPFIAGVS